jgi:hypothetical protein
MEQVVVRKFQHVLIFSTKLFSNPSTTFQIISNLKEEPGNPDFLRVDKND